MPIPIGNPFCKANDPARVWFLKSFAWLALAGCIIGLVYTVLMLVPDTGKLVGDHGIDKWGDNALKWVTTENVGSDGFYVWKYVISILSALFSIVKTVYEFSESIFLANKISDAYGDRLDSHESVGYYKGDHKVEMGLSHLIGGMGLLLLLALTNAMPIYDVGLKTLMLGVKVGMFVGSIIYVKNYIHPHGFQSFGNWITFGRYFRDHSHGAHGHAHSNKDRSVSEVLADTKGYAHYNKDPKALMEIETRAAYDPNGDRPCDQACSSPKDASQPQMLDAKPDSDDSLSEHRAASVRTYARSFAIIREESDGQSNSWEPNDTIPQPLYQQGNLEGRETFHVGASSEVKRRLASFDASSILSTLVVTVVSILVWYLFLRDPTSQVKSRRRTTIIKKRPTFVKGKRRASRKPTLSTLRSESTLLN